MLGSDEVDLDNSVCSLPILRVIEARTATAKEVFCARAPIVCDAVVYVSDALREVCPWCSPKLVEVRTTFVYRHVRDDGQVANSTVLGPITLEEEGKPLSNETMASLVPKARAVAESVNISWSRVVEVQAMSVERMSMFKLLTADIYATTPPKVGGAVMRSSVAMDGMEKFRHTSVTRTITTTITPRAKGPVFGPAPAPVLLPAGAAPTAAVFNGSESAPAAPVHNTSQSVAVSADASARQAALHTCFDDLMDGFVIHQTENLEVSSLVTDHMTGSANALPASPLDSWDAAHQYASEMTGYVTLLITASPYLSQAMDWARTAAELQDLRAVVVQMGALPADAMSAVLSAPAVLFVWDMFTNTFVVFLVLNAVWTILEARGKVPVIRSAYAKYAVACVAAAAVLLSGVRVVDIRSLFAPAQPEDTSVPKKKRGFLGTLGALVWSIATGLVTHAGFVVVVAALFVLAYTDRSQQFWADLVLMPALAVTCVCAFALALLGFGVHLSGRTSATLAWSVAVCAIMYAPVSYFSSARRAEFIAAVLLGLVSGAALRWTAAKAVRKSKTSARVTCVEEASGAVSCSVDEPPVPERTAVENAVEAIAEAVEARVEKPVCYAYTASETDDRILIAFPTKEDYDDFAAAVARGDNTRFFYSMPLGFWSAVAQFKTNAVHYSARYAMGHKWRYLDAMVETFCESPHIGKPEWARERVMTTVAPSTVSNCRAGGITVVVPRYEN